MNTWSGGASFPAMTAEIEYVEIPEGNKLVQNVEDTGKVLIETEQILRLADSLPLDQQVDLLRTALAGHAAIGRTMVEAVERVRRHMKR